MINEETKQLLGTVPSIKGKFTWDVVDKRTEKDTPNYFFRYHQHSKKSLGKFFNYPKCCITHFEKHWGWVGLSEADRRRHNSSIFDGTGFIPCTKCMRKNHRALLKKINRKRSRTIGPLLPLFKKVRVVPFVRLINLSEVK